MITTLISLAHTISSVDVTVQHRVDDTSIQVPFANVIDLKWHRGITQSQAEATRVAQHVQFGKVVDNLLAAIDTMGCQAEYTTLVETVKGLQADDEGGLKSQCAVFGAKEQYKKAASARLTYLRDTARSTKVEWKRISKAEEAALKEWYSQERISEVRQKVQDEMNRRTFTSSGTADYDTWYRNELDISRMAANLLTEAERFFRLDEDRELAVSKQVYDEATDSLNQKVKKKSSFANGQ